MSGVNKATSTEHNYDASDFLYDRQGPWPQPSPAHPWGESPAVIHLPLWENVDWWIWIGSRYLATAAFMWLPCLIKGFILPGLKEVTDEDFSGILNNSMISKFITPKLDDKDNEIFKKYIENEEREWFIIDLEAVNVVKTFPGLYASGSKTLMYRDGKGFGVRCIYIDKTDTIFENTDGDGWELAKYFMLQGGALCATLVAHPLQHFPFDSINAVSKTSLPKEHLLSRLLSPHFRFTLPLENAVLNYKSSLLQEKWWMTYAPYPGPPKGLRELLVEGHEGIKGNHSYPPFSYSMKAPNYEGDYGIYLKTYYDVFYKYVSEITKDIAKDDFWVGKWADYLSKYVRDFPCGKKIFEGDNLALAVTTYLFTVTLGHSVDHYNYGRQDKRKVPLRMRQAPPTKGVKMKKRSKLVNAFDQMKYTMADILFFSPTTVTRLMKSRYKYTEVSQDQAAKDFKINLKKAEKELLAQGIEYMPIDDVAASLQY